MKFKVGDKVRFTALDGVGHPNLVHGRVYEVTSTKPAHLPENGAVIYVTDPESTSSLTMSAFETRFELVKPVKQEGLSDPGKLVVGAIYKMAPGLACAKYLGDGKWTDYDCDLWRLRSDITPALDLGHRLWATFKDSMELVERPAPFLKDGIYEYRGDFVAWRDDMQRWSWWATLNNVRHTYSRRSEMERRYHDKDAISLNDVIFVEPLPETRATETPAIATPKVPKGLPTDPPSGYTAWEGGECPCGSCDVVSYVVRGDPANPSKAEAGILRWDHTGDNGDIIGYKVLIKAELPTRPVWYEVDRHYGGLPKKTNEIEASAPKASAEVPKQRGANPVRPVADRRRKFLLL